MHSGRDTWLHASGSYSDRGRSRNFKRGGGGESGGIFFKKEGGGVQPLTREQFVLQINKKKGGGGGGGVRTPLTAYSHCMLRVTSRMT